MSVALVSRSGSGVLTDAGFELVHRECMDKDMEIVPWVKRMRSDDAKIARLKAMLRDQRLHGFLRPRTTDAGTALTRKDGVIVAKKSANFGA